MCLEDRNEDEGSRNDLKTVELNSTIVRLCRYRLGMSIAFVSGDEPPHMLC